MEFRQVVSKMQTDTALARSLSFDQLMTRVPRVLRESDQEMIEYIRNLVPNTITTTPTTITSTSDPNTNNTSTSGVEFELSFLSKSLIPVVCCLDCE